VKFALLQPRYWHGMADAYFASYGVFSLGMVRCTPRPRAHLPHQMITRRLRVDRIESNVMGTDLGDVNRLRNEI
jgi:hypothetical protein